ncbi:MAG: DEAD/DEAH box helicase family protein [Flavobacteriaceae bacterium]
MELKIYQENAVDNLVKKFNQQKDGSRDNFIIFKSPTGSGKTIMMAEFLKRIISNNDDGNSVFVWVAPRDLHNQSKAKIEKYLKNYPYRIIDKNSITAEPFLPNDLFFFNWEKGITKKDGIWNNILVRENETGVNLQDIFQKTQDENRNIILIVDESHQGLYAERTQEFVNEIIKPNTVIMVSATPKPAPTNAHSVNTVMVDFSEVVNSGLIKKDTIINADLENVNSSTTTNAILEACLNKQTELKELNPEINPLILVQLPNEKETLSELDKTTKDFVEKYFYEQGITYENGKLAVWLSNEKKNLDNILDFDSQVQVLIFKQAIALGWDCPRASIMAMFRENKTESFQIQTVGRILRMPEAKHYDNEKLNSAYIYTALDQISIAGESDSEKGYFNFNTMRITDFAKKNNVKLPSIFLNRTDQHTLTREHFSPIFIQKLLNAFDIDGTEMANVVSQKIDDKLEIYDEELKRDIIINEVIKNLETYDGTTSQITKIQKESNHEEIEYIFEQIIRSWCLPYGIEKSKAKIKNALFQVFELGNFTIKDVKKFIVCSKSNYDFIHKIVVLSKDEYEPIRQKTDEDKREKTENIFSIPESDIVNESFTKEDFKKYALSPCYIKYDSELEKLFARHLEQSEKVIWWYKNGEGYGKYFGILYQDSENKERVFYPDFIVKTTEKLWIIDTKSGFTAKDALDNGKAQALENWLTDKPEIDGGIIEFDSELWKIYQKENENFKKVIFEL